MFKEEGLSGLCRGVIKEFRVQLWSDNQWATEAEESPLLRFSTGKRLVKDIAEKLSLRRVVTKE
jgi:hypothetical protein